MQISVLKESIDYENRIAISPFAAGQYVKNGYQVLIETGAGSKANFSDEDFKNAGANIASDCQQALAQADIILKVQPPTIKEIDFFNANQYLICHLQPAIYSDCFKKLLTKKINVFALERIPRISRAQSMDILSSQANIAGYKAVLDALEYLPRALPMMMTAAGTIQAAKVMIMGVGVAGLQAIATAKRLGAIVSATDVRPSTKEQVESLGAKFIAVEDEEFKNAQTQQGYAKAMSAQYQQKQHQLIQQVISSQDIVITTALIPNKKAPVLIDESMVKTMKKDAVIVDLAAIAGGNCTLTQYAKVVNKYGVHIIGYANPASRLAETTSQLLAKNIANFLSLLTIKDNQLELNLQDEIINQTLVMQAGKLRFSELEEFLDNKN